ncbi:MAG: hypothetical protein KBD37_08270 [Burkholderiales bacterium]|nr:hypothetical protein [Burkholderiales bacterium]
MFSVTLLSPTKFRITRSPATNDTSQSWYGFSRSQEPPEDESVTQPNENLGSLKRSWDKLLKTFLG